MNILIIYPHGNALNNRAGAETRAWNLVSWLVDNNFKVSVLHALKAKGEEDLELRKKCSNVYYYRELYPLGVSDWYLSDLNPFFAIKLFNILKQNKFDIIQIEFPYGFFITKLLTRKKSPIIYDSLGVEAEFMKVSMLNPLFPKIFKFFAPIIAKIYERLVCKLANFIICVSNIDLNYFIENYRISRKKTFLIQIPSSLKNINSNNRKSLKSISRNKLNLPKDKIIVIFHGSISHPANKEAFDIIEKVIAPKFKNTNIVFVLAGLFLERYKSNNIMRIGYVEDLKDLLYAADFAIVPILRGSGMRVKCADYISSALPFIITKKGLEGINFLKNGEHCLIYDKIDKHFLKGIKLLANNKELRNKLHNNLLKNTKKLNYKKIGNRYVKLIKKLVNP